MIFKLYENASSLKKNFSNTQTLWAETYKNRIDQPEQMEWSQFSIKKLGS